MRHELEEFCQYLEAHCQGKSNALKVGRLAGLLNCSEREIRSMAEELTVDHRKPIASTVHPPYGLYVAVTPEEKKEYCAQLDARIRALARRRRTFSSLPLVQVIKQMELEYEHTPSPS